MQYQPYSTQKGKMAKAELENAKQVNDISLKGWIASQIQTRIDNTQPRNTTLPLSTQWDSEWITATENNTDNLWINWSLVLGRFNQNWLSRFSVEIVTRNLGGLYQVNSGYSFAKFIGWDIKDIVDRETSDEKTIVLNAGIFNSVIGTPIFQAKLLVKYIAQATHD